MPWQFLDDGELASLGLTREQARSAVWWVDTSGERSRGNAAIAKSLIAGSGWTVVTGRVLLAPPFAWLGAAAYPLVARWRHRLPGGTPACRL